jgi:aryl carrier-like protein
MDMSTTAYGRNRPKVDEVLDRAGAALETHGNGLAAGLDSLALRIDRLAAEVQNVRHAVAALALAQLATFGAIVADILVRML